MEVLKLKNCERCKEDKDISFFCRYRHSKDGLARVCRECNKKVAAAWKVKNPERSLELSRTWRKENPEKARAGSRASKLKQKYNLTVEQYNNLFIQQNGCCAICNTHQQDLKANLFVDHDHETGKVRSLLCNHCNSLLGYARESTETLNRAISYLEMHK